jgi:hypothetical protein
LKKWDQNMGPKYKIKKMGPKYGTKNLDQNMR